MHSPSPRPLSIIVTLLAGLALALTALRAELVVRADRPDGIYQEKDTVLWTITAKDETATSLVYSVKQDGKTTVAEGAIDLSSGTATVSAGRETPGSLLLQLFPDRQSTKALAAGGAVFAPDKLIPAHPAPDDFDAFWRAKLAELAEVPANPVLEKIDVSAEAGGVDYYKVALDNIRGTRVRGQLARPSAGEKFPAIVTFQYAGVYPLQRGTVLNDAKLGFLALNISAHDLPIDEPAEFYKAQQNGPLKDYVRIGSEDREKSYFLRMLLGCVRAVDYLASRPDWDGRTLLVTGTSQGGLQAFAAAGLSPKVTALMVNVPAGCDVLAPLADRGLSWPYWLSRRSPEVERTAPYFDGIHFAARARCPALVSYCLLDTTSRPAGVAIAYNALSGPKQALIMPLSDHQGKNGAQRAYYDEAARWKKAALAGGKLPPESAIR